MAYHDKSNVDLSERIREIAYDMNVRGLVMGKDKILENINELIKERLPIIQSYLIGATYELEFIYVNLYKDKFEEIAAKPIIKEFQDTYQSFMASIRELDSNLRKETPKSDGRLANMLEGIWLMIELNWQVKGLFAAYQQKQEFDN